MNDCQDFEDEAPRLHRAEEKGVVQKRDDGIPNHGDAQQYLESVLPDETLIEFSPH